MGLLFTIIVGMVMGGIFALPMRWKKVSHEKCWAVFIHCMVVTLLIFDMYGPFFGPFISLLMTLPGVALIWKEERKAVPFILLSAVLLGFLVSLIAYYKQDIANAIYRIAPFLW